MLFGLISSVLLKTLGLKNFEESMMR